MTTELGNSDASRDAGRRGLSRRQMIKASAVAGAAAWTAPVIIDSLASPAAAISFPCVPYFVKVAVAGASPNNCPGSGTGFAVTAANGTPAESAVSYAVSGSKWAGNQAAIPGSCGLVAGTQMIPTVTSFDTTYYEVKLNTPAGKTCAFSTSSDWQVGGRYGTSDAGDRYVKVTDRTTTSGYGYFTEGSDKAYVYKTYPTDSARVMQYAYVMFCCST